MKKQQSTAHCASSSVDSAVAATPAAVRRSARLAAATEAAHVVVLKPNNASLLHTGGPDIVKRNAVRKRRREQNAAEPFEPDGQSSCSEQQTSALAPPSPAAVTVTVSRKANKRSARVPVKAKAAANAKVKAKANVSRSDADDGTRDEDEDEEAAAQSPPMSANERLHGDLLRREFAGEPLLEPATLFKDIYAGAHLSIAGVRSARVHRVAHSSFISFIWAFGYILMRTGGLHNAIRVASELGARALSLFLTSSRTWSTKPLADADADRFIAAYTVRVLYRYTVAYTRTEVKRKYKS